jgi:hypothetical protein
VRVVLVELGARVVIGQAVGVREQVASWVSVSTAMARLLFFFLVVLPCSSVSRPIASLLIRQVMQAVTFDLLSTREQRDHQWRTRRRGQVASDARRRDSTMRRVGCPSASSSQWRSGYA